MRRLLGFLLRNWPLKLGAILLATVLYGGIVLSQNTRTWSGSVPIDVDGLPTDAALLTALPEVTNIRYRAPLDVASQLSTGSFVAKVDVSNVVPQRGGVPVELGVTLQPIDRRVQIVDFSPRTVEIVLDPVVSDEFAVQVRIVSAPNGLEIDPPQVEPAAVVVQGASSRVGGIQKIEARVTIDDTAVNVDEQVDLLALDAQGQEIAGVEITPARARVKIPVARILASRTVRVVPQIVGQAASGYAATTVVADPALVTVNGSEPVVEQLQAAETEPIDLAARDASFEVEVGFALPPELTALITTRVRVSVIIEPMHGSRTFESGVLVVGARPDRTYTVGTPAVLVVMEGLVPELDALDATRIVARVDATDLDVGRHRLAVAVEAPGGLRVVETSPGEIDLTVVEAPAVASPSPALSPPATATPAASP